MYDENATSDELGPRWGLVNELWDDRHLTVFLVSPKNSGIFEKFDQRFIVEDAFVHSVEHGSGFVHHWRFEAVNSGMMNRGKA